MKRILTLLTLCLLLSCEKDNEIPETNFNPLITIDPGIGIYDYGKRFYFVTTLEGELLAYKQIEDLIINELYTENNNIPDKFNVHSLYVSNDGEIRFLESFLHTNQNYYSHQYICENPLTKIGSSTIYISGPTYSSYLFSYPSGAQSGNAVEEIHTINRNTTTNLYEGYNFLFAFLKREQQYYYKYFFDLNPDETHTFELDPITMETNYNVKALNAPEGLSFSRSNINSVILGSLCYLGVCKQFSEISNDSTQLSIFITPSGLEKFYKSRIHMKVEGDKEYTYRKHGDLPEIIPPLDFDITNSYLDDYNNIELTTTGSYDVISGAYKSETNAKNWRFYCNNADVIKFPDIPAEITEIYPTLTSSTFFQTSTIMSYISLNEYSEIDNYADFMADVERNKYLGENSSLQELTVNNY